jgi:hypothetical protein
MEKIIEDNLDREFHVQEIAELTGMDQGVVYSRAISGELRSGWDSYYQQIVVSVRQLVDSGFVIKNSELLHKMNKRQRGHSDIPMLRLEAKMDSLIVIVDRLLEHIWTGPLTPPQTA